MQKEDYNRIRVKSSYDYPSFSNQKKVFLNFNFVEKKFSPIKTQKAYEFGKIELKQENDVNSSKCHTQSEDFQLMETTDNVRERNNNLLYKQENNLKRSSKEKNQNIYVIQGHISKSPNPLPKLKSTYKNHNGLTQSMERNNQNITFPQVYMKYNHNFSWILSNKSEAEVFSEFLTENQIDKIMREYPDITKKEIFYYHADFVQMVKMSNLINKTNSTFVNLKVFEHFAVMLKFHSAAELNRIYNAIEVNKFVGLMDWDTFLYLRVLTDDKGNKNDIVDFLYRYFDESGTKKVEETEVIHCLQQAAQRITTTNEIVNKKLTSEKIDLNIYSQNQSLQRIGMLFKQFLENTSKKYSFFHQSQKETLEKCMLKVSMISSLRKKGAKFDYSSILDQTKRISIFSDQYALSIWKWMVKNEIIQNGVLLKEKMLLHYDGNKYIFLLLVNTFLGYFFGDFFTWVREIHGLQ